MLFNAMFELGDYYEKQKDDDNIKKYYLMAIDKGNVVQCNVQIR
jgi:hypothetical protein